MRIALVTHYYPAHAGGIEIVAGRVADLLAARHEIVWLASGSNLAPPDLPGLHAVAMRGTNIVERLTGLPFPLWGPISIAKLRRAVREADAVHLHDFMYPGNCAAFVFARLNRKPILITQHVGLIPYKSALLRGILRSMHRTVGRWMLGRADRVVFVSSVVRKYFKAFVRFHHDPLVVFNGVDTEAFSEGATAERTAARDALGLPHDAAVLLFVGRFVEKKGLHILKALATRMPETTWLFAGWGQEDPERWALSNVRVFRDRRGADLTPLYHAADLFVLPSVGEGLPLVVQEAMSAGTPAIVGEDTAVAVDAPAGLVLSCTVGGDDEANRWETAVRALIADRDALARLRPGVATFARERWSWTTCANTYERLLADILSACARPSSR